MSETLSRAITPEHAAELIRREDDALRRVRAAVEDGVALGRMTASNGALLITMAEDFRDGSIRLLRHLVSGPGCPACGAIDDDEHRCTPAEREAAAQ